MRFNKEFTGIGLFVYFKGHNSISIRINRYPKLIELRVSMYACLQNPALKRKRNVYGLPDGADVVELENWTPKTGLNHDS